MCITAIKVSREIFARLKNFINYRISATLQVGFLAGCHDVFIYVAGFKDIFSSNSHTVIHSKSLMSSIPELQTTIGDGLRIFNYSFRDALLGQFTNTIASFIDSNFLAGYDLIISE